MTDVPVVPSPPRSKLDLAASVAVLGVAVVFVGMALDRFWPDARQIWWSMTHDRNAHYWAAQSVALDIRNGDPVHLARDIERMRVWGPLHPIVTGIVLAVGGVDYRVAVLPAAVAWALAGWLGFLTARRLAPRGGELAGFAAAVLVLASPAYQAFATDIMLEGPGACLSLAFVYAYVRARQEPSTANYRWVALALSGLFFLKYNYWLLALFALGGEAIRTHGRAGLRDARRTIGRMNGSAVRGWLVAQLRHPLTYPLLAVLAVLAVFAVRGPFDVAIGGKQVGVKRPDTITVVAVWLVVVRLLPWWWRTGSARVRGRWPWAGPVIAWHVWPVIVWFLLPARAANFVWYLTRDHGVGEGGPSFVGRSTAYLRTLAEDYHNGPPALIAVGVLTVAAFALARRLRPGAGIVLMFVAVSVALTLLQPTGRGRFLHSWVAVGWVAAGVGLAGVVFAFRRGPLTTVERVAGVFVAVPFAILCGASALRPGRALEGGVRPAAPCVLQVSDEYLPRLDGARRVAMFSQAPNKFFLQWTYQDVYRRTERVIVDPDRLPAAEQFAEWADREQVDAVVWLDLPRGSPFFESPEVTAARKVPGLLAGQSVFVRAWERDWPEYKGRVEVWRRRPKD
ncbi:MAG TPA: glycosyltransferase family 39 protein [Gemmataceae bacterium]|nr:glycosyltransferase family 39 protein [Gemmataceae bacterium]